MKSSDSDQQLIDRAKRTLMRYLGMSEEQSHRYLVRSAMNLRMRKTAVARAVLQMYDLGDNR